MQHDTVAGPPSRDTGGGPTPIPVSRRARTVIVVVGLLALAFLLSRAPSVGIIALGGATLAILLSFPVRFLAHRMRRGLAVLLTFVLLIGGLLLAVGLLVPVLATQIVDLVRALPGLAQEAERAARSTLQALDERGRLPADPDELIANGTRQVLTRAEGFARTALAGALGAVSGVLNLGVQLFGMLFVAVYLLLDSAKVERTFVGLAPRRYRGDAEELWRAVGHSLSRYLSGLSLSLAIQGILSAIALWLIGVPYALLLGVWVSVTALIPNLGAFLGAIPAIALALFESPSAAILTVVLFVAIQQLEGNILTPRIQGQAVRVHPIVVLLAVIGATEIFGLLGAVFAVPVLAILRALWDFFDERLVLRG